MLFDTIDNCHNYFSLNTRFSTAFEYVLSNDFSKFEPGRYEVDGNEIFVLVSEYKTKPFEEGKWEAHRKYIDIHIMAKGAEKFGFAPIDFMKPADDYDEEKDFMLLNGEGDFVKLKKDTFLIAFPHDVHMPGIAVEQPEEVKKVIVKVKVGMLQFHP